MSTYLDLLPKESGAERRERIVKSACNLAVSLSPDNIHSFRLHGAARLAIIDTLEFLSGVHPELRSELHALFGLEDKNA